MGGGVGGVLTGSFCAAGPELSPLSISGGAGPTGPFTSASEEGTDKRADTRMTEPRPKRRAAVSWHLPDTRLSTARPIYSQEGADPSSRQLNLDISLGRQAVESSSVYYS